MSYNQIMKRNLRHWRKNCANWRRKDYNNGKIA